MAEPSFSRSLEIKSNRFRWILMRTAILIFLRQEEQEHFFLLSSNRFIDGEINFFHREMDTRSTISIPRWGDQRSLPEKGMSRSCCTSLFIDLFGIYYRTTFLNNRSSSRIWLEYRWNLKNFICSIFSSFDT